MTVKTVFDILLVFLTVALMLTIVGLIIFFFWKLVTYLSDEMRERRKIKEELSDLAKDLQILFFQKMAKHAYCRFIYTDSDKEKTEKDILDRLERSDRVKHY